MSKLLSTAQVAEMLGVTRETVADYAFNGSLPAARIGQRWRFELEDVELFIKMAKKGR